VCLFAARAAPSQAPPVYHPLEGVGRSRLPELLLAAAVPSLRGTRDAAVVAVRRQPGTFVRAWALSLSSPLADRAVMRPPFAATLSEPSERRARSGHLAKVQIDFYGVGVGGDARRTPDAANLPRCPGNPSTMTSPVPTATAVLFLPPYPPPSPLCRSPAPVFPL
jgi:hypothetical protein